MNRKLFFTAAVFAFSLATGASVRAGTLENLERERALTLEALLDGNLAPAQRQAKMAAAKPRLMDLERMTIRDKSLAGRNTPTVRRAFENYDLTFMAHAATERNLTLTDNWLDQVGVSTESLMAAQVRRRW